MSTVANVASSKTVEVNPPLVNADGAPRATFTRTFFDGELPAYMKAQYHLVRYATIAGSAAIEYTFQHREDPAPQTPRDPEAEAQRESRRLITHDTPVPPVHQSLTQLIPTPEPDWFITYRKQVFAREQRDHAEIVHLKRELKEQVKKMQASDNLALATYGEKKDLAVVKERVSLTSYGAGLSETGRGMVAQLCWLMDWNPFFDVYAFPSKGGRVVVMPSYQKLLEIVKEKERINYEARPMTPQERTDFGLKDSEIGSVVEITEVDMFLDFVKAGVGDQYKRIKGFGVWRPGDNIPSTWTSKQVADKRALRNALAHLVSYKIASKRLQQALEQMGVMGIEETEDGYSFNEPAAPLTPIVVIDQPATLPAAPESTTADTNGGQNVVNSEPAPVAVEPAADKPAETSAPTMADQIVTLEAASEIVIASESADKPAMCSNCGLVAADPASPYPTMCATCGTAEADRDAKKTEARRIK